MYIVLNVFLVRENERFLGQQVFLYYVEKCIKKVPSKINRIIHKSFKILPRKITISSLKLIPENYRKVKSI